MKASGTSIIVSISVASAALCFGPLWWFIADGQAGGGTIPTASAVAFSVWLGWTWIATFVVAFWFARWRALWLLFLPPFALVWPAMWVFYGHACDLFGRCGSLFGLISRS
jgi:hypothetical protein